MQYKSFNACVRPALVAAPALMVLSALIASASNPGFTVRYEITDLGTLGGFTSVALGINDLGHVVGSADISSGVRRAFLWRDGVMQNLGTIAGLAATEAWDINNHDQVVGPASQGGEVNSAFLWENSQMSELGDPAQAKSAFAINDAGQIVGAAIFPPPISGQHAMLLENGVLTDLTAAGFCSGIAWDIDVQGDIVGGPCIWRDGANIDLGLLSGGGGAAISINDHGQAVGNANRADGTVVPVSWDNGEITDLGPLVVPLADFVFSKAEAINNKGQIVGAGTIQFNDAAGSVAGAISEGFIVDPVAGAALLKDTLPENCGWSEISPRDINDESWIVGAATTPEGFRHAFLMTPLPPIPATSSALLVLLTIATLIAAYLVLARRQSASEPR